jgi:hypothetical protein
VAALLGVVAVTLGAIRDFAGDERPAEDRPDLAVESLALTDGPGRLTWFSTADCWRGPTVHLVARVKNRQLPTPTTATFTVRLSAGPDDARGYRRVEEAVVLSSSAVPRQGHSVAIPLAVDVPGWMQDRRLTWIVTAQSSQDAPSHRGYGAATFKPCGQNV